MLVVPKFHWARDFNVSKTKPSGTFSPQLVSPILFASTNFTSPPLTFLSSRIAPKSCFRCPALN
jgi:hypothetical protein